MRRFVAMMAALSALAVVGGGARAWTPSAPDQQCVDNGGPGQLCRGIDHLRHTAGVVCRDATANNAACTPVDETTIDEKAVAAQQFSWLNHALSLQRGLDDNAPLQDELWTHTHNSFNADVYAPTFYGTDRNQIYSITDQLRMGIRAIEIDIHWAQSTNGDPANNFYGVMVCHGSQQNIGPQDVHFGCGVNDPLLVTRLHEVRAWLDANPGEFLMLYLENQLAGNASAHAKAAQIIADTLGPLVYKPAAKCAALPMNATRAHLRATHKRIIITGNCDDGKTTAWGNWVHVRGVASDHVGPERWVESGTSWGKPFPAYPCVDPSSPTHKTVREEDHYDVNWIRHWGDETGLSDGTGGGGNVTPADARNMVACGVNMIGFDNLEPFDPRLEAEVWSWVKNEPKTSAKGTCAYLDANARFRSDRCGVPGSTVKRPFACYNGTKWSVTHTSDRWDKGARACAVAKLGRFSVPWNGFEDQRLKAAARGAPVWLNYRAVSGSWTPNV